MLLNLSDAFLTENKIVNGEYSFEKDELIHDDEVFKILEKSMIKLTLSHMARGEVRLQASGSVTVDFNCDRCLSFVPTQIDYDIDRRVYSPDVDLSIDDEEDNITVMEGYQLNLDSLIFNEILMNWPVKVLCQTECKGICTICGKNLNDMECDCDTFVPDPRMAVIKDIFIANKEV